MHLEKSEYDDDFWLFVSLNKLAMLKQICLAGFKTSAYFTCSFVWTENKHGCFIWISYLQTLGVAKHNAQLCIQSLQMHVCICWNLCFTLPIHASLFALFLLTISHQRSVNFIKFWTCQERHGLCSVCDEVMLLLVARDFFYFEGDIVFLILRPESWTGCLLMMLHFHYCLYVRQNEPHNQHGIFLPDVDPNLYTLSIILQTSCTLSESI